MAKNPVSRFGVGKEIGDGRWEPNPPGMIITPGIGSEVLKNRFGIV